MCSPNENTRPVEKLMALRCFGAFALVCGIAEFIIGLIVYTDLTSPSLGAWWAGLVIMIGSFLAVLSTNRFDFGLFASVTVDWYFVCFDRGVVIAACVFTVSLLVNCKF